MDPLLTTRGHDLLRELEVYNAGKGLVAESSVFLFFFLSQTGTYSETVRTFVVKLFPVHGFPTHLPSLSL